MNAAAEADKPVPSGLASAWYVAHTKPRQEQVAQENLRRQGFGVYLPKLKVLKYFGRRRQIAFEPLFPRYLFFRPAHAGQSIAPVRSTLGVASIVRFGAVPALLQPDTLESIRAFECQRNEADLAQLSGLERGMTVVVTSGPLAGLHGLVDMVSKERVIVLMRLLGEETKVKLSLGELKLAA